MLKCSQVAASGLRGAVPIGDAVLVQVKAWVLAGLLTFGGWILRSTTVRSTCGSGDLIPAAQENGVAMSLLHESPVMQTVRPNWYYQAPGNPKPAAPTVME